MKELVRKFQLAAIADSLPINVYNVNGVWDEETERAATAFVYKGAVGNRVSLIQELLTERGFYDGKIDFHFGEKTKAAVEAFNKSVGVFTMGVVARDSWIELLKVGVDDEESP